MLLIAIKKFMASIRRFEDLEVWQKSRVLYKKILSIIQEGRLERNYRFIAQVESAVGSVMDNIAEGFERGGRLEFIQFLGYAKGSCGELRSQIYRMLDARYLLQDEFDDLLNDVISISSQLQKLIAYLQRTEIEGIRKVRNKAG